MPENCKEQETGPALAKVAFIWNGMAGCMMSDSGNCCKAALLRAQISSFHDEQLAEATTRINQILDEMKKHNQDSKRELALISVGDNGFLLAWVTPAVSQFSGPEEFSKALGIK